MSTLLSFLDRKQKKESAAKVLGRGLIARTLRPVASLLGKVIVFASGPADSSATDQVLYDAEMQALRHALQECCTHRRKLIYFSSGGKVYGDTTAKRSEETPCIPSSNYGRHKLNCEELIRSRDCQHLIVRLPNLVGPCQNPRQLIPALVRGVLSGKVNVFQGATRDLLGVDEFREILLELAGSVSDRETLVVASGVPISSEQMVSRIQSILNTATTASQLSNGKQEDYDISKLCRLAPNTSRFSSSYPLDVLDRYVPLLAEDSGLISPQRRAA